MGMRELRKTLQDDRVVFLRAGPDEEDTADDILADLAGSGDRVVFITTSKPAMSRKDELEDAGIADDTVFFIDGSGSEDDQVRAENIVFVNPRNLTQLSISMTEAVDQLGAEGPVYMVLDSLATLLMYHDDKQLKRFLHLFCTKMRAREVSTVLISVEDTVDETVAATAAQFADTTLSWN